MANSRTRIAPCMRHPAVLALMSDLVLGVLAVVGFTVIGAYLGLLPPL